MVTRVKFASKTNIAFSYIKNTVHIVCIPLICPKPPDQSSGGAVTVMVEKDHCGTSDGPVHGVLHVEHSVGAGILRAKGVLCRPEATCQYLCQYLCRRE